MSETTDQDWSFPEMDRETGIPCFQCGLRSGLDCPGRRPDEATRCRECFKEFMAEERELQFRHLVELIGSLRERGDATEEDRLWAALEGYEDLHRLSAEVGGRD